MKMNDCSRSKTPSFHRIFMHLRQQLPVTHEFDAISICLQRLKVFEKAFVSALLQQSIQLRLPVPQASRPRHFEAKIESNNMWSLPYQNTTLAEWEVSRLGLNLAPGSS